MSLVMRKPAFCISEHKNADQLRGNTAKLINIFVFATRIVQSLYFLNTESQASSHLLWLYSPVCVGPGQIPRRPVFSLPSLQSYQLNDSTYSYFPLRGEVTSKARHEKTCFTFAKNKGVAQMRYRAG